MNGIKNLKSNKGITLLDVILYMIAIVMVLGIMTSVRSVFFDRMTVMQSVAKYAQEFDNFNAYFVKDVKRYYNVIIKKYDDTKDIELKLLTENDAVGITYTYKKRETGNETSVGDIYRGPVRVASNVKTLNCKKNIIYIDNVQKVLLRLELIIGGKTDVAFTKAIQYTFKYWK